MRARLGEEQLFYHFSKEAQQQTRAWEHAERNSYHAQLRNYEHRVYQEASQERLNVEAAVGQTYLVLRQELQQAEKEHTVFVRQEARRFAEGARAEFAEEVHHHQIAQAQAQSLLAAERQHHEAVIEEQADRWQDAMDLVTEGAEEANLEEVALEGFLEGAFQEGGMCLEGRNTPFRRVRPPSVHLTKLLQPGTVGLVFPKSAFRTHEPKIRIKTSEKCVASLPRGPCNGNCLPLVTRQFLTRNYPRPNCLLQCLPNCLSPHKRGLSSSFKILPAVRAIAQQLRQKLSRGKLCPTTSRCLFWPTGWKSFFGSPKYVSHFGGVWRPCPGISYYGNLPRS